MSWIKKWFSKFNEDDIEEIKDEHQSAELNEYPDHRQTMDTKVIYQYPKAPFRFPVISDTERIEGRRSTGPRRKPANKGGDTHTAPARRQERKPEAAARPPQVPAPVRENAKPKKIEPQNRQPFTPTEIPSPVYGFHRPPERRDHESAYEYVLQEDFFRRPEDEKPEFSWRESEPEQLKSEQLGSLASNHIEEQFQKNPEADDCFAIIDEAAPAPKEYQEEAASSMALEDEPADKENGRGDETEDQQPVQENEIEWEPKGHTDTEPLQEEVAPAEPKQPLSEEPSVREQDGEAIEEPRRKSGERKHLPFNVLMLKQDKQKMPVYQPSVPRTKPKEKLEAVPHESREENAARNEPKTGRYEYPSLKLLKPPVIKEDDGEWVMEQSSLLDETLENFNVRAKVVHASQGPSVTRFEVQPEPGVKVNKVTNLSDDIKLSMAARDIRIEAPIPGKRSIGIELPNLESRPVLISEILGSSKFLKSESPLTAALGLDISGSPVVTDLRKMPHGLIAGATGSGKSVCINSILVSLLYKARPDELKLMLIDPKMVELAPYNEIPHLVSPVITDVKAATAALKWAVDEMERRYELFAHTRVRDIRRYNELAEENGQYSQKLPYIVIVIDELADLMMVSPADVEEAICRIAQKARACGIHLLVATQRPSVDVITGLIKANIPTRVAFSVSSQVDSRTIIDMGGAEKLLGRGDMLFLDNGSSKPVRLQGTFVSDEEIDLLIRHVRKQGKPQYLFEQEDLLKKADFQEEEDELFFEACEFVIDQGGASTSLLQRRFRIGYNRAARLIEMMEQNGIISEARGSKPRDVLVKAEELEALKDTLVHY